MDDSAEMPNTFNTISGMATCIGHKMDSQSDDLRFQISGLTQGFETMSISVRDLQRQEEMHELRLAALESAMEDVKGDFNTLEGTADAAQADVEALKRATAATTSGQSEALRKLGESCTSEIAAA